MERGGNEVFAGCDMNLIAAVLWLGCGIGLFVYEHFTGEVRYKIRGLDISIGWLLLMALYNFARWYGKWSRVEDTSKQFLREARVRQAQVRERPEPDPNFDFSTQPTPPEGIRPPIDRPPSKN
jgi:hypothetical protein